MLTQAEYTEILKGSIEIDLLLSDLKELEDLVDTVNYNYDKYLEGGEFRDMYKRFYKEGLKELDEFKFNNPISEYWKLLDNLQRL